jgi:hypothetical protein
LGTSICRCTPWVAWQRGSGRVRRWRFILRRLVSASVPRPTLLVIRQPHTHTPFSCLNPGSFCGSFHQVRPWRYLAMRYDRKPRGNVGTLHLPVSLPGGEEGRQDFVRVGFGLPHAFVLTKNAFRSQPAAETSPDRSSLSTLSDRLANSRMKDVQTKDGIYAMTEGCCPPMYQCCDGESKCWSVLCTPSLLTDMVVMQLPRPRKSRRRCKGSDRDIL